MASYKYVAKIPLSQIDHIEIYDNTKTRKTVSQVKEMKGADYALNGGLFNMRTYEQYCSLKINGTVISDPGYEELGMTWNKADIALKLIPTYTRSYLNWIGCVCLCQNNIPYDMTEMDRRSDLGGKRGRSAIGLTGSELVLWCSKDGTSYAAYPSALRDELMKTYGCKDALMLDGGGSSQCNFKGNVIYTGRIVANIILVYLKKTAPEPTTDNTQTQTQTPSDGLEAPAIKLDESAITTNMVLNIRKKANSSSGLVGTLPAYSKVKIIGKNQAGNWYRIDKGWIFASYVVLNSQIVKPDVTMDVNGTTNRDIVIRSGPGSNHSNIGTIKKNTKLHVIGKNTGASWYYIEAGWVYANYVYLEQNKPFASQCPYKQPSVYTVIRKGMYWNENVRWLQWYLRNKYNINIGIDGCFGPNTERAVKEFQTKYGLEVDGIAGPKTINAILNN